MCSEHFVCYQLSACGLEVRLCREKLVLKQLFTHCISRYASLLFLSQAHNPIYGPNQQIILDIHTGLSKLIAVALYEESYGLFALLSQALHNMI